MSKKLPDRLKSPDNGDKSRYCISIWYTVLIHTGTVDLQGMFQVLMCATWILNGLMESIASLDWDVTTKRDLQRTQSHQRITVALVCMAERLRFVKVARFVFRTETGFSCAHR
jgi:hypothetical protein